MPVIYLQHPIHGTKVATLDMEADFDEQNGWIRYNPDTPSTDEEAAPEVNNLPVVRRGRRKKTEESVETPMPEFLAPQSNEGE